MISKLFAIFNIAAGCLFTACGAVVVYRTGAFLSAAPPDQAGTVAWACLIAVVGIGVVFCGLGYVRTGTNLLLGSRTAPDDF